MRVKFNNLIRLQVIAPRDRSFQEKTLGPSLEELGESERSKERESHARNTTQAAPKKRKHGLGTVLGPLGVGQRMCLRTRGDGKLEGSNGPEHEQP